MCRAADMDRILQLAARTSPWLPPVVVLTRSRSQVAQHAAARGPARQCLRRRRARQHARFTPAGASLPETGPMPLRDGYRKQLRRGTGRIRRPSGTDVLDFIGIVKDGPKPSRRRKSADDIIDLIRRFWTTTRETRQIQSKQGNRQDAGPPSRGPAAAMWKGSRSQGPPDVAAHAPALRAARCLGFRQHRCNGGPGNGHAMSSPRDG